jgi:hypothetical protein
LWYNTANRTVPWCRAVILWGVGCGNEIAVWGLRCLGAFYSTTTFIRAV